MNIIKYLKSRLSFVRYRANDIYGIYNSSSSSSCGRSTSSSSSSSLAAESSADAEVKPSSAGYLELDGSLFKTWSRSEYIRDYHTRIIIDITADSSVDASVKASFPKISELDGSLFKAWSRS